MLSELGARPSRARELFMTVTGCLINGLCRFGGVFNFFNFGWYMSMYGAGRLEAANIAEYQIAAKCAEHCGELGFVDALLQMAEVEWDHESYFREKCRNSKWAAVIPLWPMPPAREAIRASHSDQLRRRAADLLDETDSALPQ